VSSERGQESSGRPRVLIVAYDFPPHAAIGTLRTLRLVRHLCDEGWGVTVLTGSPGTYLPGTPVDAKLELQVPDTVRVLRARTLRGFDALVNAAGGTRQSRASAVASTSSVDARDPPIAASGRLLRAKNLVDAALSIPDKESGWIAPATLLGLRHILAGRPDILYSSAPPWSGQAVALMLARLSGRPWVADFRDPWSRAPWRDWQRPFRQRAAAALERRVINRADAVLFVTNANLAEFSTFYGPAAAHRFHMVPNGCDPAEFEGIEPLPPRDPFVLLHAGSIYGGRNPGPILDAIASAMHRGSLDRTSFRLRLLGDVSQVLKSECSRLGIGDVVEFAPRVARAESLRELRSASALLLVQTGTTVSIPGKAYEYLAAGRPILALSEEGETADLVRASGIGVSVRPGAPLDQIESALLSVVALAQGTYAAPRRELYDGGVHAQTTARILLECAQGNRLLTAEYPTRSADRP
jgi:glycosyltransferase involved in cell wall biosynthesis